MVAPGTERRPAAPRSGPDALPPGTFTRDELDAAEPERPPSLRGRWLVGLVLGALGGWVVAFGSVLSVIGLAALPFALTPAGAGALVGAGIMGLLWLVPLLDSASRGAAVDPWLVVTAAIGGVLLVAGAAGSLVVGRRRRRDRREGE